MAMGAINWEELDKKPKTEQAAFFNGKFGKEPISSFHEIRRGDHFVTEGASGDRYYHHSLCIGHDEQHNPKIIHYYTTESLETIVSDGIIQEMVLPHKDFLKDEAELRKKAVKRIVWLPEVRRFSVDEVVRRACRRKGERHYNVTENNCESFVMWCLFDMNISLQVKAWHAVLQENANALRSAGLVGSKELFKAVIKSESCKVSSELAFNSLKLSIMIRESLSASPKLLVSQSLMPHQFSKVNWGALEAIGNTAVKYSDASEKLGSLARQSSRVAGVGTLIQIVPAVYDTYQAYKQWTGDENERGGREKFIWKAAETITASASSHGLGSVGAVVGQTFIPIPIVGAAVGGMVGSFSGHIIASKVLSSIYDKLNNPF